MGDSDTAAGDGGPGGGGPPDTRLRLVLAAMELFAEKGFGATSVAEVARAANAHPGSLYHFFPTKQALLEAVLDLYYAGIDQMLLAPAWAGVADPVERVFALLAAYRAHLENSAYTYGCPIGSIALELHEPDERVRELLVANFTNWTQAIVDCLTAAKGRLPRGTDKQALAEFVLTTMEGGVMQARTYRDVAYFDRNVAMLRAHFDLLEARAKQKA